MNHKLKMVIIVVLIVGIAVFAIFRNRESQELRDYFIVTLTVSAETLLGNMHLLHRDKHELVPIDGLIFPETAVIAYEGESVFDVLNREMRNAGIHLVFRRMPIFDFIYIEAINNIFEFDAGALSGWKYRVNGVFPGIDASSYILQDGDFIELLFTLALGRDLGDLGYE